MVCVKIHNGKYTLGSKYLTEQPVDLHLEDNLFKLDPLCVNNADV